MLVWLEDEEEDEEEGNLDSIEPRLAVEKVPAVAWRDYIDCITSGRAKQAEAKLSARRLAAARAADKEAREEKAASEIGTRRRRGVLGVF